MPLSEHEQKILTDLEESLSKQDPRFPRTFVKPMSTPAGNGACERAPSALQLAC